MAYPFTPGILGLRDILLKYAIILLLKEKNNSTVFLLSPGNNSAGAHDQYSLCNLSKHF